MCANAMTCIVEDRQVIELRPNFVHKTKQSLFDFVRIRMECQEWRLARDYEGNPTYRASDGVLSPLGSLIPCDAYSTWLETVPCYSRIFWQNLMLFPPEHATLLEDMEVIHQISQNSVDFRCLFMGLGLLFYLQVEDV